jgi:arabinose-5-phosphate isomerase
MNQAIPPTLPTVPDDARAVAMGRQVLEIEAAARRRRAGAASRAEFRAAVALILESRGRVVVSGIGKSGHIARKLAATFASTGTPAYFVHAAEAVHGDLGMITRDDVLIAISNSGENDELLTIVPLVKRQGGKLIAITGNETSSLAQRSRHPPRRPRRPGGLPAEPGAHRQHHRGAGPGRRAGGRPARRARLRRRGFRPLPPRRRAGPQAADPRRDVMQVEDVPTLAEDAPVPAALAAMTRGGMGMDVVLDAAGRITGIFTDGDLRRAMERLGDLRATPVSAVMTRNPRSIAPRRLAVEAVEMMEANKINQLLVTDDAGGCAAR